LDSLEDAFKSLKHVQSAEVVDVRRTLEEKDLKF